MFTLTVFLQLLRGCSAVISDLPRSSRSAGAARARRHAHADFPAPPAHAQPEAAHPARDMGATSSTHLVYKLLIHLLLLAALIDVALGQGAQMVGGRPPTTVTHDLCDIASVFSQLSAIKTNPDCTAGCAHSGQCPADWYPGAAYALSPPSHPTAHLPACPLPRGMPSYQVSYCV
eukprot:COSAG06_NODE_3820_length_4874_cov_7.460524_2_plen_175_part_00